MKALLVVLLTISAMLFPMVVVADDQTQSAQQTQEKMVNVPYSMLSPEQKAKIEAETVIQRIETVGKFVGLGKEIGEAVNGSLQAITTQSAKFANTKLGGFIMLLVAWKVMGNDLIQLLVGIPLLIVLLTLWFWSYRRTCLFSILVDQAKEEGSGPRAQYDKQNRNMLLGTQAVYFCVLLVIIAVCALVLFC